MVDLEASADPTPTTPLEDLAQFEAGRAEAFGALCAVFSSQPCGEPFLPVYLGWFYHCLCLGLQQNEVIREVEKYLVSILFLPSPFPFLPPSLSPFPSPPLPLPHPLLPPFPSPPLPSPSFPSLPLLSPSSSSPFPFSP